MRATVIRIVRKGLLEMWSMRSSVIMPASLGVQVQSTHLYSEKRNTGNCKNR
jgi:hypothetical protein